MYRVPIRHEYLKVLHYFLFHNVELSALLGFAA